MTGAAEDEVVELASQLIAIDTTNTGEPEGTVGEREAAEYVAGKLTEVGYEAGGPRLGCARSVERLLPPARGATASAARCSSTVTSTWCPPTPSEWSVHPFSGAVQDGYVWGRGAVDMKDMDAMMIAVARQFRRDGVVPPRDLVFAFLADEEAGGALGAQWLVEHRPDLFDGCTEAVGEVGGFSLTVNETAAVPDRGRREGPGLDAAAGPRACRGTGRSCTTTTPSPRSPRRSRAWATTGSR